MSDVDCSAAAGTIPIARLVGEAAREATLPLHPRLAALLKEWTQAFGSQLDPDDRDHAHAPDGLAAAGHNSHSPAVATVADPTTERMANLARVPIARTMLQAAPAYSSGGST